MKASALAAMVWVLAAAAGAVSAADRSAERELFREGWQAAARGDQAGIMQALSGLADYPIAPYLQFELFRQRVDQVPTPVMTQFLARHRDWSFASSLERAWLRSLGERGEYALLLEHAGQSSDTQVRCHAAAARIERNDTQGLAAELRELWLVGRSQPKACNGPFAWWRRQGHPDADTAWQRFRLAVEAGERQLAGYLKRYLPSNERDWADRWLSMSLRPQATLREARQWRDLDHARVVIAWGLERQARSDWEAADEAWRVLSRPFTWSAAEQARIEREIALFRAVALDEGALAAIDALPEAALDDQLYAWRARVAMADEDWSELVASIEAMSLSQQASSRWRYWRGRAFAELGRAEALLAFGSLSSEANYHGFLAAHQLGQPLSLCHQDIDADPAVQRRLMRDAEFERMGELFEVDLNWHAWSTWARLASRLSAAELEQVAVIAAGEGWHHLAIGALNRAGRTQAYPWRFPLAAKGIVQAEAKRYDVDPALAWGLMRAESAMRADARSSAGALGLLQLMPATAQAVAQRNGLSYSGAASLTDPQVNIPLGIAHLSELYRDFNGSWLRVAAAYNAGPGAVRRWLDERPDSAPDVWIETLPYYETRDYVPRVLAFATIYEWQLERNPTLLAGQIQPGTEPAAGFVCPP